MKLRTIIQKHGLPVTVTINCDESDCVVKIVYTHLTKAYGHYKNGVAICIKLDSELWEFCKPVRKKSK